MTEPPKSSWSRTTPSMLLQDPCRNMPGTPPRRSISYHPSSNQIRKSVSTIISYMARSDRFHHMTKADRFCIVVRQIVVIEMPSANCNSRLGFFQVSAGGFLVGSILSRNLHAEPWVRGVFFSGGVLRGCRLVMCLNDGSAKNCMSGFWVLDLK